ncbi:hypothetical protein diail_9990 [Diaporthe ilicicola]|nr:hypothetical protein diail_9990 [Diaporthe ilicicola]
MSNWAAAASKGSGPPGSLPGRVPDAWRRRGVQHRQLLDRELPHRPGLAVRVPPPPLPGGIGRRHHRLQFKGATAAYRLSELQPDLRVVLFRGRGICTGATGRNGGYLCRPEVYDFQDAVRLYGADCRGCAPGEEAVPEEPGYDAGLD